MVCPISINKFIGTISLGLLTVSYIPPPFSYTSHSRPPLFKIRFDTLVLTINPGSILHPQLSHHTRTLAPPLRLSRPRNPPHPPDRLRAQDPHPRLHLLHLPADSLLARGSERQTPVSAVDGAGRVRRRAGGGVVVQWDEQISGIDGWCGEAVEGWRESDGGWAGEEEGGATAGD